MSPYSQQCIVRPATAEDMSAVFALVQELAEFERAPEQVITSPEIFKTDGFGQNPAFIAWVVELDSEIIAMALCYTRYSTWKGKVLYLEDFYVKERFRQFGIGNKLFDKVLEYAKDNGFQRLSWQVLEWNEPAIQFYKKIGASLDPEWINGFIEC